MLSYEIESIESMRARAYKAVERLWTTKDIDNKVTPPGAKRENVFDFDTGCRIIINRMYDPALNPRPMIHASFSFMPAGVEGAMNGPNYWINRLGNASGTGPDEAKCTEFIGERVMDVMADVLTIGRSLQSVVSLGKNIPNAFFPIETEMLVPSRKFPGDPPLDTRGE